MSCIVYIASKNPNGAPLVKTVTEYSDWFTNGISIGASYGCTPVWDLSNLTNDFFLDGIDPTTVGAVEVPNFSDLEAIRTAIQSHALTSTIKQYNADNGIVSYRKVVDTDTQAVLIDWEIS